MPESNNFFVAATAAPPVQGRGSAQLNTLEAPLDALVPYVYHRSLPQLVRPVCVVTVEYYGSTRLTSVPATVTTPAQMREPAPMTGSCATITYAPAVTPHRTEVEAALSGDDFLSANAGAQPVNGFSFGGGMGGTDENGERKNAKQGFLETLLNGGTSEGGGAAGGADAANMPFASQVRARVHDDVCDASHVEQSALLVQLVGMVAASRADAGRSGVKCVTAIDLSYTNLGLVGSSGPATVFGANGEPIEQEEAIETADATAAGGGGGEDEDGGVDVAEATLNGTAREHSPKSSPVETVVRWALPMRFFPDESEPRDKTPAKVLADIAERSLSLCYIAPLLYQPSGMSYRIERLVCVQCGLGDKDAKAIAQIVRHKFTKRFECHLRAVDLSQNKLTNVGAQALCSALKYNRLLTLLDLAGNEDVTDEALIDTLNKRLRRNRDGKSNLHWYEKPKRWFQ